jgi:DNA transformation protein
MAQRRNELADHVTEQLAPLGAVRARAMFGGHGIYLDDLMFALIADETLYFKVDDANRADYEAAGSTPFKLYADRATLMPYWVVPDEVMEDRARLIGWARKSVDAALRARAVKSAKPAGRKK